jgi:hypothetical protein
MSLEVAVRELLSIELAEPCRGFNVAGTGDSGCFEVLLPVRYRIGIAAVGGLVEAAVSCE